MRAKASKKRATKRATKAAGPAALPKPAASQRGASPRALAPDLQLIHTALKRLASKQVLRDMSVRYGIITKQAYGVSVGNIHLIAKRLGGRKGNHELAAALWDSDGGWYEARMLCAFIDDPALVTSAQMDRWCKDFDNWGICDTICFHLFDKAPSALAFRKVTQWSVKKDEFVKRAAFALLASVALHNKTEADESFLKCLPLIERAAADERNFVKKGVSWALRGIGKRNARLNSAARQLAERLAKSADPSARWVGKDALRDLMPRAHSPRP